MQTIMRGTIVFVALLYLTRPGVAQDNAPNADSRTLPLAVGGRALDDAGRPISGATVYLVSTNSSPWTRLGEVETKEDGRYEFQDIALPESRFGTTEDGFRVGYFQVFGKSAGRAFAWRGMKALYSAPENPRPGILDYYHRTGFAVGQTIDMDLTFSAASAITGRFVDERGKPITSAKLQLIFCDSIQPYAAATDLYSALVGKESRSFYSIHDAARDMPDELLATTDSDGRFSFKSVPSDALCGLMFSHPDFAFVRFTTTTAASPPSISYDGTPVRKLPVEMTLGVARTISVSVVDDAGQPIPGVHVVGNQFAETGIHSANDSNAEGIARLRLPPGRFKLEGRPPRGATCIVTTRELIVENSPDEQDAKFVMNAGCTLILKAIDIETGAGVPGVKFWYEMTELPGGRPGRGRSSVQSTTSMVDNPKTDATGTLMAVVVPGRRKYGVGLNPLLEGYAVTEADDLLGRDLSCLPAERSKYRSCSAGWRSNARNKELVGRNSEDVDRLILLGAAVELLLFLAVGHSNECVVG